MRPIDEYAEGITLGFPARGFVSAIEAMMDAYVARKDSGFHAGGRGSAIHKERHSETPADCGVGVGGQE